MFEIPPHSLYAMLVVLALLVISSGVAVFLSFKNPEKDYTELRQRIVSWWWMIGILFVVLSVSTVTGVLFFAFLSFIALKEFFSIVPIRQTDRRVVFWAYLAIPVQYYWCFVGWYGMFIIFIPVYVFLFMPIRMILLGETKGFIRSAGTLHWGVMLTVFGISHIAYLLILPPKNMDAGNIGLVIFLLFMTQFNDVAQYIWGKSLGRNKITPSVSPNKTWEGFLGGVGTITLCSALLAPYLTPLNWQYGLAVGVLISVCGFFGDLVMSAVKRDLRIKDCSSLIPGHGGVLDRIDSLTYTAPLFFHFTWFFAY